MTMNKLSKKQLDNFIKWLCLLLSAGALGLALCTLHDLQTAEGVGLYLSIIFGQDDRTFFDILMDIIGMLLFLLALILPCIILKCRTCESFFRMLSLYIAFMPIIHPGITVHLNHTLMNLQYRQTLVDGNILTAILESFIEIAPIVLMLIPILLLSCAANRISGSQPLKVWQVIILALEVIVLLIHFLFPDLSQETSYLMHYLLLMWCFAEYDKLCQHHPSLAGWSMILFGGCWLRGIYRMIELMSITQL